MLLVVAVSALTSLLVHRNDPEPVASASSSAPGTSAQDLLTPAVGARGTPQPPVWASDGESVGAWIDVDFRRDVAVDHVEVVDAEPGGSEPLTLLLSFGDGSSLLVTTSTEGRAAVSFPTRTVSTVRLTVAAAGSDTVALSSLSFGAATGDDETGPERDVVGLGPTTATRIETSSGSPQDATALQDGSPDAGDPGLEWSADPGDDDAWVGLAWDSPVEVASLQVLGPTSPATAGTGSDPTPLSGVVRFDDGSSVVVTGIEGGASQPTTIAFAPRVVTSARLELTPAESGDPVTLREFHVYGTGTTPPRWPVTGRTYEADAPAAGDCRSDSRPGVRATADLPLVLVCPAPGSTTAGVATIVVATDAGADLTARAPVVSDGADVPTVEQVAGATAGDDGRAVLEVDTSRLPNGPVTVTVEGLGGQEPLSVQLVNRDGVDIASPSYAPEGMTLQWDEGFDSPLSVSGTGRGARYAAGKPTVNGAESFGDAAFVDPALGAGTVGTLDGYLRLRAEPTAGRTEAAPYDQEHLSGLISSARVGGGGFAAQYGYFEARMVGAPGSGTWPAFWTLNTQSTTPDDEEAGEADTVELYGHNPTGSCHSLHDYAPDVENQGDEVQNCLADNGFSDWTQNWHTYGMRVGPDGAVFTIDGVQVLESRGLGRYDEPFFFLVDLALGSGYPVELDATDGTSDLYVDWVRVYT